jgi:hypothetical protein
VRHLFFQVEGWKRIGATLYVGGRNCGTDIRVGDAFSSVLTRGSHSSAPTALRVEKILLYGKYLNQIDSGMTAELELSGADAALPEAPLDLHGDSELPSFDSAEVLGSGTFHLKPM